MKNYLKKILLLFLALNGFLFFSSLETTQAQEAIQFSEDANEELISLDFEKTDIKDVMRVLAQKGKVNIILGQDVKADVTIQLKDVTWQKALDIILQNYNLTFRKELNLIRIMTLEQLKIEEEKVPLITEIVTLDFANVEDIKTSLESMLSSRGSIQTNSRTNALIVSDIPDKVRLVQEVAQDLDSRTPQVMIEALMADVKVTDQESVGLDWTLTHNTLEKEWLITQDLDLNAPTGSIFFNKTLLGRFDIESIIDFFQQNQKVNILANPRVMTLDNLTATIELVEQVPYRSVQETESGSYTTTQFKDVGIKLYVTPHITTKENYISMNIKVEQSFRSGWTDDYQPMIDSRQAETNLMVRDGETIVIGGLRKKEDSVTVHKIPILGDMPFLGALFRKTVKDVTDVDLIIFVTPTIITKPVFSKKEKKRFDLFSEKREYETDEKELFKIVPPQEVGVIKKEPFTLRPPN